jgi:cytochrome c oxidase subunit IV
MLPILPGIVMPRLVWANIAVIERVFIPPALVVVVLAAIAYAANRLVFG